MARATLKDVAQLAGVSTATVSYALSGKKTISEETKQRIYDAIEQLDYVPDLMEKANNIIEKTEGKVEDDDKKEKMKISKIKHNKKIKNVSRIPNINEEDEEEIIPVEIENKDIIEE